MLIKLSSSKTTLNQLKMLVQLLNADRSPQVTWFTTLPNMPCPGPSQRDHSKTRQTNEETECSLPTQLPRLLAAILQATISTLSGVLSMCVKQPNTQMHPIREQAHGAAQLQSRVASGYRGARHHA